MGVQTLPATKFSSFGHAKHSRPVAADREFALGARDSTLYARFSIARTCYCVPGGWKGGEVAFSLVA